MSEAIVMLKRTKSEKTAKKESELKKRLKNESVWKENEEKAFWRFFICIIWYWGAFDWTFIWDGLVELRFTFYFFIFFCAMNLILWKLNLFIVEFAICDYYLFTFLSKFWCKWLLKFLCNFLFTFLFIFFPIFIQIFTQIFT